MKNGSKHKGVVVPMITPVTADGKLDEKAVDKVVAFLLAGGVDGIFVMGTTGEGTSIPRPFRRQLVQRAVESAKGRAKVYVGIGDAHPDEIQAGNEYFATGADAVVSRPPVSFPTEHLGTWYRKLLDGLNGPLIMYNMPMTTHVSIPLDVIEQLLEHPNLIGIKDSENNPKRLKELLSRFGGKPGFSIFVGVGALMAQGLKLGASGIVPSVGNLIPDVCHHLCVSAERGDWVEADSHFARMNAVAALYQQGRTLNESLSVLKAVAHCRGLCEPHVLPPLRTVSPIELDRVRKLALELQLNGH
jgi:dihydrodipicolinate synthase/N-acetylneuraminate lyase